MLALSPAGPGQVHLARPDAWPELRALAGHGVSTVRPPDGTGANWATVSWAEAAELRPDVVLVDVRSNATPVSELDGNEAWLRLAGGARVLPWNPESPASARSHSRFFTSVAGALEAVTAE